MPKLSSLQMLQNKADRISKRLEAEATKNTRHFAGLGWGYAMRHGKLPTYSRETRLQDQLDQLNNAIKTLA